VLHLGNGTSICALRAGASIATTMGFTTLDGLPMGARSGSLDPGVILYLMQALQMDAAAAVNPGNGRRVLVAYSTCPGRVEPSSVA